jgi:hypothetical protein
MLYFVSGTNKSRLTKQCLIWKTDYRPKQMGMIDLLILFFPCGNNYSAKINK